MASDIKPTAIRIPLDLEESLLAEAYSRGVSLHGTILALLEWAVSDERQTSPPKDALKKAKAKIDVKRAAIEGVRAARKAEPEPEKPKRKKAATKTDESPEVAEPAEVDSSRYDAWIKGAKGG